MSTVSISSTTAAIVPLSGDLSPSAPPPSPISHRPVKLVASYPLASQTMAPDAAEEEPGFGMGMYEVVEPLATSNAVTQIDLKEKRIQMVLLIAIQGASKCATKIQKIGDRVALDHNKGFSQSFWRWMNGDKREDLRILEKAIPYAAIMFPPKANVKLWQFIRDGLKQLVAVYGEMDPAKLETESTSSASQQASDDLIKEKITEIEAKIPSTKSIDILLQEQIQTIEKSIFVGSSTPLPNQEAKIAMADQIRHPYALANNVINTAARELHRLAAAAENHTQELSKVASKIEGLKLPFAKSTSGLSAELAKVWSLEFIDSFVKSLERIKGLPPSTHGDDIRKLTEALEVEMNIEAEKANRVAQVFMYRIWNS